MFKIFKTKNFTNWKTTTLTLIGAVLMIAGVFWPDKLTEEAKGTILEGVNQIIIALGVLIPILVGVFGSKDGDK